MLFAVFATNTGNLFEDCVIWLTHMLGIYKMKTILESLLGLGSLSQNIKK